MKHGLMLTMLTVALVVAALGGGCSGESTTRQTVEFIPTGGPPDPERIGEYMQKAFDAIDWDAVFAEALKDPKLTGSGWQPPAEKPPAEGLAAAVTRELVPGSSFVEISVTADSEAQSQAVCDAVVDAFRKLYGARR